MARLKGIPRVPPLPNFVVFRDRLDGTEWVLSWADDEGTLRMSLNDEGLERADPLPPRQDCTKQDYFDLGQGVRLFVRDGHLGAELVQYEGKTGRVFTRVGVQRHIYEVVRPEGWTPEADAESGKPIHELGMTQENDFD